LILPRGPSSLRRAIGTSALLAALLVCCRRPSATGTLANAPTLDAGAVANGRAYAGRRVAPTMGFEGAEWLDRPEREESEQPEKVLDALAIPPGATVADVGAGTGYFTLRLARRVGPEGHVLATDIEPRMLGVLAERAAARHLANIETRVVTSQDPRLDPSSLDLVLMVDVYHELADPREELTAVKRALRPGGRLVLVEYRGEDPAVQIKPEHKMTRAQIEAEVLPAGFRELEDLEFLRDQRVMVFVAAA
jgi:SAM-dependent methyltransferase